MQSTASPTTLPCPPPHAPNRHSLHRHLHRAVPQDKYGVVHTAVYDPTAAGGYRLLPTSRAHLSGGRPLGGVLDAEGNVILCNSGQVGVT